ncbi:FXYD domain containing ion transport regulator 5 isoform X9 [Narcine bancroftii]|uniref:FXYD domain containing ion transport regulator 5 isoform X9 n=1 Tax=Narcine bancroftii TaxID=1343680 RepID=UPI00383207B7
MCTSRDRQVIDVPMLERSRGHPLMLLVVICVQAATTQSWAEDGSLSNSTHMSQAPTGWAENGSLSNSTHVSRAPTGWAEDGSITNSTHMSPTPTEIDRETNPSSSSGTSSTIQDWKTSAMPEVPHLEQQKFTYDYTSLRRHGMVMGAIFFIMGVIVLFAGHDSVLRCPWVRFRRARTYKLSRDPQKLID